MQGRWGWGMEMWTGGGACDRTSVACGVLANGWWSRPCDSSHWISLAAPTVHSCSYCHTDLQGGDGHVSEWGSQSPKTVLLKHNLWPCTACQGSVPVGQSSSSPEVHPGPLIGPHWLLTTTPEPITVDRAMRDVNCQAQGLLLVGSAPLKPHGLRGNSPKERKAAIATRPNKPKCREPTAPAMLLLKPWFLLYAVAVDISAFSSCFLSSKQGHHFAIYTCIKSSHCTS